MHAKFTRFISLLVLVCCSFVQLPAQSIFGQLQRFKQVDVPFEYINNFIVIRVTLNDYLPMRFIFDTGAEYSILTKKEIARVLRMPYEREYSIVGSDMKRPLKAYLVRSKKLSLGELTKPGHSLLVLEDDYFQFDEFTGVSIQGILGADFFKHFIVRIDYRRQRITLFHLDHFNVDPKTSEIPISIYKNKIYVYSPVKFHRDSTTNTKLLLDTGASLPLLLHHDTHESFRLPENAVVGNIGSGLGGSLDGYLGRINQINIGPYSFDNTITSFQATSNLPDTSFLSGRNGIIGNVILSRFEVTIDYIKQKLYLKARKNYQKGFRYDRSGLVIVATGEQLNTFEVQFVIPTSPAEKAGLQEGDQIISVNGVSKNFLSLKTLNRRLQHRKNKQVKIKYRRGDQKFKTRFKLADYM